MATNAAPSPASGQADPLAVLGALPGVPEAVDSVRQAVDRLYGHRVMRRRSDEVASEAALRGARGSAALAGADWPLEEVRRRSDFSADDAGPYGRRGAAADRRGRSTARRLAAVAGPGAGPAASGGGGRRGGRADGGPAAADR